MLLFGRVTIASTLSIAYLYTTEIFPTVIRGSCLGLCVVFAKIGSLIDLLLLVRYPFFSFEKFSIYIYSFFKVRDLLTVSDESKFRQLQQSN